VEPQAAVAAVICIEHIALSEAEVAKPGAANPLHEGDAAELYNLESNVGLC
jgi:hypothetical protein